MDQKIIDFLTEKQKEYESIAAHYNMIEPHPHLNLVRLMRYVAPIPEAKQVAKGKKAKDMLVSDGKGKMVKKSKTQMGSRILPVVMVVQAGQGEAAKIAEGKPGLISGEMRLVMSSHVVGIMDNPAYIDVKKSQRDLAGARANRKVPPMIPKWQHFWGANHFLHPFQSSEEELDIEEMFTFLIPSNYILQKLSL